jgi:hypothetical protein
MIQGIIKLNTKVEADGPQLLSYSRSPGLINNHRVATMCGRTCHHDKASDSVTFVNNTSSAFPYKKKVGIAGESANRASSKII